MKKTTRIKVIKRQNAAAPDQGNIKVTEGKSASSHKKSERDLANCVKTWIRERQEEKRAEEFKNIHNFFSNEASTL